MSDYSDEFSSDDDDLTPDFDYVDDYEEEDTFEDEEDDESEDEDDNEFDEEDEDASLEELSNGFMRQDYYDVGFTDTDIELWGLDQPGAPNPDMAGFVISDMQDGKIDGELDLSF